jgi:hypothetical protein
MQVAIAIALNAISLGYLMTHSHESMTEAQNGHQHSVNGTGTQN